MNRPNRRSAKAPCLGLIKAFVLALVLLLPAMAAADAVNTTGLAVTDDTVTVGILHSMTGTIAINESSVIDAEKLAIEQINAQGGVLGRQIKVVVEDGASDWPTFAEKAKKLLNRDKVAVVFGCYTSASRKAVLPVFEKNNGLLYYPTYYEGLEESPNMFYTAQEATQQNIAAVKWLIENKGYKTFYLIGSDYIWPRTSNKIAKATIKKYGGKILAEEYYPLGHTQFGSVINKIKYKKPDVILSTVVGGSNVSFYKQLKAAGISGDKQPIMAFAVSEEEVRAIGPQNVEGVYTSMGYFESLDTPENKEFVKAFKAKYGQDRVIGDVMECGYISPFLWKMAVEKAGSFDVDKVAKAMGNLEMAAPEGKIKVHPTNHHLFKYTRIGRIQPDGQVKLVFETDLIEPNPFPKL